MNKILLFFIVLIKLSFVQGQNYNPIISKKTMNIDTFFSNYIIEDNYRWLENTNSIEAKEWIDIQNSMAKKYLFKCTAKTHSFRAIENYSHTKNKIPHKKGDYFFTYGYYTDLGVAALFYRRDMNFPLELLVDPNYISSKDKIVLKNYFVSKDSKLLAYQFSRNGSDWGEVKVVSLNNGVHLDDYLTGLKFSNLAWEGNGFFYSTFEQTNKFGKTVGQKVFYHKIGTDQAEDKLIFRRRNNPLANFDFITTSDERYFILEEYNRQTHKTNIFYIDYATEQHNLKPLLTNSSSRVSIVDSHEGKFIGETFHQSNYGTIIEIDPDNPYKWKKIIPEFPEAILLDAIPFSDRIVAIFESKNHPVISVFDYSGNNLFDLAMPLASSISGFSGSGDDEDLYFSMKSYTIPSIVYKFNIKTFKKELMQKTTVNYDFTQIEYKEVNYMSDDSISISMILVYKKGLILDGANPTLLSTYGGFGVVNTPSFDPGIVFFVKKGGVYAFANVRGGGDKGKKWALAGRGTHKQSSFDDFIAAAEYLIEEKYTSPDKLAITGASNGGLVVAVAAIQRPDLFKAVVPVVAPFDMIRFEKFTVGSLHADEYGSVSDSIGFENIYGFSPLTNIKEDVNYPSMLVITSENDDRVPPFHSYKFVARMQSRSAQKNPILLKIEKQAGHYGASTWTDFLREESDLFGFVLYQLTKKE